MDRFYSPNRDPDDPWFRLGTLDVNTTVLITGLSTLTMFIWAVSPTLLHPLYMFPYDVKHGQFWRVLTWPVANGPSLGAVLSIVFFYLFGRELERSLGRVRFLWFLASITLVTGVVATLLDIPMGGLFLVETAVFVAFIAAYPTAMGFFNIPLWVFGVVIIGIELLQYIGTRAWQLIVLTLIVVGMGLLESHAFGLSELTWIPKLPMPGSGQVPSSSRSRNKKRRRRSGPATVTPIRGTPTSADLLRQAEVDLLLEKINEHGIKSLTPEERRRLDEHSRRMRDERP